MVVLPLSKFAKNDDEEMNSARSAYGPDTDSTNWVRFAAAATLVASGALLLGGKRRAGLLAAASGTTLAMLDQKDVLSTWWRLLPGYIEQVQWLLTQTEGAVEEFAAQRQKLGKVLGH